MKIIFKLLNNNSNIEINNILITYVCLVNRLLAAIYTNSENDSQDSFNIFLNTVVKSFSLIKYYCVCLSYTCILANAEVL